jgi:pre-mRNA-splicing factor 18
MKTSLSQVIESTKKEREQLIPQKRKWTKRGDMEAERERKYLEEREQKRRKKEEEEELQETSSATENNQSTSSSSTAVTTTDDEEILPKEQVIKLLRQYNQPITLFGENDIDRYKRLKAYQMASNDGEFTNSKLQRQNDFALHLKRQDEEFLLLDKNESDDTTSSSEVKTVTPISLDLPTKQSGQSDHDFVRAFLRKLLKLWDYHLNHRTEDEKKSAQGKMDAGIYQQAKQYIKPLLRLLKKQSLQSDILGPLKSICYNLASQQYTKASDIYLQLSIGNAPWPMGVTAVGIHARSSRQRIESSQIAHVLNDEQQRKYIQSVKRLMTFCENFYNGKHNNGNNTTA